MTTTRDYRSTDPGMPVLSGQAGKLVDVLDVIVNGGAPQSVTSITRSGDTATVTKAAHGFRNGVRLQFEGADQAAYNIEATITVVNANTYTYPVSGAPASPATGTITAKMAGAGWSKPFSGSGKGCYRAPQGNRFYLRLLDDGSDPTNGAKVATIRGYVSMTDVDTGTEPFPTVAQMASGYFVGKSTTADATARPWRLLVDEKRVIGLHAHVSGSPTLFGQGPVFGDLVGSAALDVYDTLIHAATTSGNALNSAGGHGTYGNLSYGSGSYAHTARASNQSGSAHASYTVFACSNTSGNSSLAEPDALGVFAAEAVQVTVGSGNTAPPRGYFPGVLFSRHYLPLATYPAGYTVGQYEVVRCGNTGSDCFIIDTGNWE